MAVYCPRWVYAACIGLTARDFLVKDIPLDLVARKYAKSLLTKYEEVNAVEIASIAEDIIRILAEVEAGEDASYGDDDDVQRSTMTMRCSTV